MTDDIDLAPAPTPRNLERLATALTELDARVLNPGNEEWISRTSLRSPRLSAGIDKHAVEVPARTAHRLVCARTAR